MNSTNEVWLSRGELDTERFAEALRLGLSEPAGQVAARRATGSLRSYLQPRLADLPSPSLLPDMQVAAERLADAVCAQERITIFGDYDADGCTSSAVLSRFLGELGSQAKVRLPHRLKDGYGLAPSMVEDLAPDCDLLITVDCGATAFPALELAQKLALPVIVCDHHTVASSIPPAVAIINPKRPDSDYPPGEPAAVGVAWNLAAWTRHVLRERGYFKDRPEPDLVALMGLVALGSVADMVPLTGANRIFVRHGLKSLENSPYPGMRVLRAHAKDPVLSERSLGFDYGPRLNAAGRLADADLAWRLLVSEDETEAKLIFEQLDELNKERRELQKKTVEEVMRRVAKTEHLPDFIVAHDPSWHPGVVGLAAGRLVDRYHRPAAVIGMQGKGSARAPEGVNLVAALATMSSELASYGGHLVAAGLTMAPGGKIERLRAGLNLAIREQLGEAGHQKRLLYDAELPPWRAHLDLARELRELAPFGIGNPPPVLLARGLEVVSRRDYKSDYTRIAVAAPVQAGQVWLDGFRMGRTADTGQRIDVLYEVNVDFYREQWLAKRRVIALRPEQP
jgi:single-stranded-DNA-specific exonuclease